MKRERIIEFVGGSEQEIAFLRLLLRKVAARLTENWRSRREDDRQVDLVVINEISDLPTAADAAPQRRVRVIDSVRGAAGMETTAWPLSQDEVVRLLNATTSGETTRPQSAPAIQQNAYDDIFESDLAERWQVGESFDPEAPLHDFNDHWLPPPRLPESALMEQAEQLFRREPDPVHKDVLASIRLHDRVQIEATDGTTERAEARAATPIAKAESNQAFPLASYLSGRMLSGPSRIEAGQVVLTLDPRNRSYHAKGALCAFEDCCKQALRRGDWHALSTHEFNDIKEKWPARPYIELLWLCAYVDEHSADAAAQFAADARFRLIQSIDLQRDYPVAACIARELDQRSTLASAALAAGVSLQTAQRVAVAFDAVGCLIPD
jgi:hypothetical protein